MGWSKRGTGKSYNSMNGYATLIGYFTRKIVDYATRNRKCKACDISSAREDHDCRLNFAGSAKAMEADAAVELVLQSEILRGVGLGVGVLIDDEDSSTMSSIYKKDPDVAIFKLADKNNQSEILGENFMN
ncbi:hypothetical protein QAD02_002213 [Eretmocerus hayati]|uniref:Uncharacterized protein n=1 Tax=Eretmocerus hayati TaxID=131215 RepID=A0ACC2NKW4_9HYME|nr:hypothetical protein QAD02_002213 [Eretmocerus hayati]